MNKIRLIIFAFFLASCLYAQSNSYSLEDCFPLALSRSEVLADEQEQVIQAEERYKQAVAALFPNVGGVISHTKQDPSGTIYTDQVNIKLTATQPLFRGFRLVGAIKQNESLLKAQKQAKEAAALLIYADVSRSFYLLLYLQRDKQLLEEQLSLYDKRLQELTERYKIGRSRQTEILSFEVSRSQLKTQIAQSQAQIQIAENLLSFFTGLAEPIMLKEEENTASTLKSVNDYKKRIKLRPDMQAAEYKIAAAKTGVEVAAGAMWWPAVDLNGNYYLQHAVPNQSVLWDAQILFTFPSFINNPAEFSTNTALSVQRQYEIAFSLLERKTEEDIDDLYNTLESEKAQIQHLENAYDFSAKNVKSVIQDYRLGLSNNLDVLQALNAFIDTRRALNKVRYAYKTDFADLAAIVVDVPLKGAK
ncbi:MAG: TolC family protein [Candidatus Margulisbacteria bacterium]|nr:TolC family protein [Candidatus Margulisiibacteriota bacterium]